MTVHLEEYNVMKLPCIMCIQYIGGCSVHRGEPMSTLGDIMSTSGGVQYIGGIS